MRNLTNSSVRVKGKKQLIRVFKDCRFIDALTLNEQSKPKPDDFIFYYNKARDGKVGNYIIYEIISTDAAYRSDDKTIGREQFVQVDVFSVKSFESKLMRDTLERLETKLTAAGFEVDMQGENYEPDTKLYHQVIYVTKLYF